MFFFKKKEMDAKRHRPFPMAHTVPTEAFSARRSGRGKTFSFHRVQEVMRIYIYIYYFISSELNVVPPK